MRRFVKTKILTIIMAIGMVFAVLLCGSGCTANMYSESQHIKRVTKLAKKRYLTEGSPYASLQIFPLYTEEDKLGYFVIEFEPYGYVYIRMNQGSRCYIFGMYMRSSSESKVWRHYTVEIGLNSQMTDDDGNVVSVFPDCKWKTDENGNFINYRDSHFKVANIENEKRYLLAIKQDGISGYIPAVKRGEQYLNLVSLEEINYEAEIAEKKYAIADIYLPLKGTKL